MNQATFYLDKYYFHKVNIDFNSRTSSKLDILFDPSGVFYEDENKFEINLKFSAKSEDCDMSFVEVECISIFKFNSKIELDNIPTYFYKNSIAIIFPYLRAFISTVTLQANIPALLLPTLNLSSLEEPLREKTIVK